ncbi:phage holin [Vibrio quintilis]|uniref:Lysis protein S n=1 Tax=Vibrio quintilis TaxID=1117707 RepID=A0A1M7YZ25_9VIBR|nr:phage holin [Vibrio quintilis]SHO57891.1 hypothetical protein VQ7734_03661 [Vibrio quintilis]
MRELHEKIMNYVAYLISASGMLFSSLSSEQWYFISSTLLGVITIYLNFWHKRKMQKIAQEQGVFRNENTVE